MYSSAPGAELEVDVRDNDAGAVLVTQTGGSTVVSDTESDTYTLQLAKVPTAPVTIAILTDGQTLISADDPNPADEGREAGLDRACRILCGLSAGRAAGLTAAARKGLAPRGALPAYEVWRIRLQDHFAQRSRA